MAGHVHLPSLLAELSLEPTFLILSQPWILSDIARLRLFPLCQDLRIFSASFLRHVQLFATPWSDPLSMGILQARIHWSGLPWPPAGDLPNLGIDQVSCFARRFFTIWAPREALRVFSVHVNTRTGAHIHSCGFRSSIFMSDPCLCSFPHPPPPWPHNKWMCSWFGTQLLLELPSLEHSVLSSERPTDLKGDHEFKERIEADGLPLCQIPEGVVTCLTFEWMRRINLTQWFGDAYHNITSPLKELHCCCC